MPDIINIYYLFQIIFFICPVCVFKQCTNILLDTYIINNYLKLQSAPKDLFSYSVTEIVAFHLTKRNTFFFFWEENNEDMHHSLSVDACFCTARGIPTHLPFFLHLSFLLTSAKIQRSFLLLVWPNKPPKQSCVFCSYWYSTNFVYGNCNWIIIKPSILTCACDFITNDCDQIQNSKAFATHLN